jgi:3-hexulose-6-phosphate synthase
MERRTASDIDRRSFLNGASRFAVGALTAGAIFEMMRPTYVWAQQLAKVTHTASARVLDRLRTRFTFQISVDVATLEQGLGVAGAALAGGVSIVEMGTPLLKNEGVSNVVPAFRRKFPEALLLADMKTMDGGAFEARAVYAGGGNIIDFLALAGVDTAKAICAVRDEFRRADPTLIERHYLGDVARAIFERVGGTAPVQVVGGLSVAHAKSLAQAGLRAFVISGNLGQPDARARYDLPPDQIERYVAGFIAAVSSA